MGKKKISHDVAKIVMRDYRIDGYDKRGTLITSASVVMFNGRPENEFYIQECECCGLSHVYLRRSE